MAPAEDVEFGAPPRSAIQGGHNRYLWIIDDRGIPYILESPLRSLGEEIPKHTNLTGGDLAYVGGELWFADGRSIYVSGASGRYPPRDEVHLAAAVAVFTSYEYEVKSLGWDSEADSIKRYLENDDD